MAALLDVRGEGFLTYADFRRMPAYLHGAACLAATQSRVSVEPPWWLEALLKGPRQATAAAATAALREDILLLLSAYHGRGAFERAMKERVPESLKATSTTASDMRNVSCFSAVPSPPSTFAFQPS